MRNRNGGPGKAFQLENRDCYEHDVCWRCWRIQKSFWMTSLRMKKNHGGEVLGPVFRSTCKSSGSWTQRFLPVFWQKRSARSRRDILNCEPNSSLHMFNLKVWNSVQKKVKRVFAFLRFGLQLPLKLLKVRNAEICASLCCAVELFDSKWN